MRMRIAGSEGMGAKPRGCRAVPRSARPTQARNTTPRPGRWQFWIDRGGTFTDVVAVEDESGCFETLKLLSENPESYDDAAEEENPIEPCSTGSPVAALASSTETRRKGSAPTSCGSLLSGRAPRPPPSTPRPRWPGRSAARQMAGPSPGCLSSPPGASHSRTG